VEKAHNVNLNYSMFKPKVNLNASLSYNHTGNAIQRITTLSDTGGASYTTYQNIGTNRRVGLNVYGNYNPNTKLRLYVNASLSYTDIRANNGSGLQNSGFNQYISGNAQYSFPLDFRLSFNGGWSSPNINIQGQSSGYYYYSLGLSKSFLDKKLTCTVSGSNFFNEYRRYTSETITSDFYSRSENLSPSRFLRFSISYRFGEMKQQIKKVQRSINNDDVKTDEGGSGGGGSGGQ
jgi:hypothetical protein